MFVVFVVPFVFLEFRRSGILCRSSGAECFFDSCCYKYFAPNGAKTRVTTLAWLLWRFSSPYSPERSTNSSRLIGKLRIRFPVAAKIALTTAGAIGGVPGSPTPPCFSVLGTM